MLYVFYHNVIKTPKYHKGKLKGKGKDGLQSNTGNLKVAGMFIIFF